MKEIDDTELRQPDFPAVDLLILETWFALWLEEHRVLERLANLEARKPPQDTNPDPEWYA